MKIHPTAIVDKSAKIDADVEIGPYSIIDANVTIKRGTRVASHCVIAGHTTIGEGNRIFTGAVIGSPSQDLKYKDEVTFVEIGKNNIIREYVTINSGTGQDAKTLIGDNNSFMAYAHVAHDCIVGNNVIMANNGTLAGHVTLEDKAIVGGLTAIHQFTRIGTLAIIGGCSKVTQDVPPYSTADGHPTKKIFGLNNVGLERSNVSEDVRKDLKRAFRILFNSGHVMSNAIKLVEKEVPASKEVAHLLEFIRASKRGVCK